MSPNRRGSGRPLGSAAGVFDLLGKDRCNARVGPSRSNGLSGIERLRLSGGLYRMDERNGEVRANAARRCSQTRRPSGRLPPSSGCRVLRFERGQAHAEATPFPHPALDLQVPAVGAHDLTRNG